MLFNRGVPTELRTYNTPTDPVDREYGQAAFVTDTWSLGRVTLSYGVRWGALSQLHTGADEGCGTVQQRANVPGYRCSHVERRRSARRHELGCDGRRQDLAQGVLRCLGDTMGADFASTYNPNAEVTTRASMDRPLRRHPIRTFPSIFPTPVATTCREASI